MSREPNRNVYVGHRYVPKVMGEWDKTKDYEGLSIVTYQGNSYTSKKRVPVGINISNEEFWVVTGNYNIQVENYRDETERVAEDLLLKSDKTYVDTELGKKSDKTYVDTELGKKSDKTYVDNELGKKSDITYVDSELDKKSDITYVDDKLDLKSDKNSMFFNIKDYGVKGNGEDETELIQSVFDLVPENGGSVYIPAGEYVISKTITVKGQTKVFGDGVSSTIKKTANGSILADGSNLNGLFYLKGLYISFSDLTLFGNQRETDCFILNGYHFDFQNLKIERMKKTFRELDMCFIVNINSVNIRHSMEAFVFNNRTVLKTTLSLVNCVAENCAQSYEFVATNYSSLRTCAADYGNYLVNNPYGSGYGDMSTDKAVYEFSSCRSITMLSCGAENCYNNGVVRVDASDITINGLSAYFINSRFIPNYQNNPNWGLGGISTTSAFSTITATGLYFEGVKNEVLDSSYPEKSYSMIANNYAVNSYGSVNRDAIIVQNVLVENIKPIFGGQNGDNNCLYIPEMLRNTEFKDSISKGYSKNYVSQIISGSGNSLNIPVTPNSNAHTPSYINIKGINGNSSSNLSKGFTCEIAVTSLTNVNQNIQVLKSSDGVTVTNSENNIIINTGQEYDNGVIIDVEFITRRQELFKVESITLT